jgi:predicted O-methyltransferase YrrM
MKSLLPETLHDYVLQHSLRQPDILNALHQKTLTLRHSSMMSSPDAAQFLALLAQLIQAKRIIEVGVFTGYTTLALALALPCDGKIIACDISTEFTDVGKPFWQQAGVAGKIDLRIAPALETLDALIHAGQSERVDLIFIDAEKQEYPQYFEKALQLIRPHGLIAIDNPLGVTNAHVCQEDLTPRQQKMIDAIHRFNTQLMQDQRVQISLLPVSQGLTLAVKSAARMS